MNEKARLYRSQAETRQLQRAKAKRIATRGEELAVRFLQKNSYSILARNYHGGRDGEIDIVACAEDNTIVFVEVKTRTLDGITYGIPELGFEAVGYRKQRRILLASQRFMKDQAYAHKRWRFDVLVIQIQKYAPSEIEYFHVENAFY